MSDIGDQVRNSFGDYVGGFNQFRNALVPQTPDEVGNFLAYNTPVVGNALSARDAYNALGDRDYRAAALAAVGMLPFGGMIKAFHGSPHDFDHFDMSKIGTGEGAQAFGHGLYFADNERVAKSYRNALTADNTEHGITSADGDIYGHREFADAVRDDIGADLSHDESRGWNWAFKNFAEQDGNFANHPHENGEFKSGYDKAKSILMDSGATPKAPGAMYEVNINADPEHFLDWDKPLSEQSEAARNAFMPHLKEDWIKSGNSPSSWLEFGEGAAERNPISTAIGRIDPQAASSSLREAGVPGIKYLDQGSRAAGEGSRNYVVFDDKLVNIVRKYGIPGAIGLGLITPEIGRQMQEQGI